METRVYCGNFLVGKSEGDGTLYKCEPSLFGDNPTHIGSYGYDSHGRAIVYKANGMGTRTIVGWVTNEGLVYKGDPGSLLQPTSCIGKASGGHIERNGSHVSIGSYHGSKMAAGAFLLLQPYAFDTEDVQPAKPSHTDCVYPPSSMGDFFKMILAAVIGITLLLVLAYAVFFHPDLNWTTNPDGVIFFSIMAGSGVIGSIVSLTWKKVESSGDDLIVAMINYVIGDLIVLTVFMIQNHLAGWSWGSFFIIAIMTPVIGVIFAIPMCIVQLIVVRALRYITNKRAA